MFEGHREVIGPGLGTQDHLIKKIYDNIPNPPDTGSKLSLRNFFTGARRTQFAKQIDLECLKIWICKPAYALVRIPLEVAGRGSL